MPKENATKIGGANERERESKRLRRFVTTFFLILSLILQNFLFLVNSVYAASSPWTQTDWVGGSGQTSWSDSTKYSTGSNITDSTTGQVTLSPTGSWCSNSYCDSNYKYRKKITFSNTDANLGVTSENLVNFPVLVKLSSSNIDYTKTQDSGQDIRFTDTDGSDLAYEIEKWDETGTSWVWVKVSQIDINSSTDYIYLYYGNTSATDHQQATSVWNSNYVMVQHLAETSGTTTNDSTSNNNDGTKLSATEPNPTTSGQLNGAQTFDGSNDYVNVGALNLNGNATVSVWIKSSGYSSSDPDLLVGNWLSAGNDNYGLFWYDNWGDRGIEWIAGGNGAYRSNTYTDDSWHYVVGVRNDSTELLYVDGSQVASASTGTLSNTGFDWHIGAALNGNWATNATIDEVRISNSARSAAWIAASYKSETDAFNTFNTEEERYVSTGTLTSSIFDTEQQSNWGTLTYNTDGVVTTTVKARTSNSSSMTGATDFTTCNDITSGTDISSNNCITDTHRYIQYQISLTSVSANTPTFQDVSIAFTASDTTPPSISLTALSPDPNNDNTPSLSGTATDAAGTVSSIQFQMDSTSGSWTACTADDGSFNSATEAFTCNVSPALSDGSHTIYVRATDSNSNTTSDVNASTDTFTIDTTAPAISVTALTPDPTSDNTPSISGTATDATTALTAIEYQVDSTSGSWTTCSANDGAIDETSEAFTCTTGTLSDGSHTIYIKATDSASNTTASVNYGSDTFTVDTGIPTVTLTAISPDPGTDTTPTISGTATDTGGTISNVQFQVDSTSGTWSNCTASDGSFNSATESFSCTTSALSDGSHTIYVRVTDNASNNSSNASDSFIVDTTNPASFDLDSPGNESYTNSERPSFKWKASSDVTAGLSKYVLEVDNPSIGSSQPSGDFTIDDIPTSRTTDYETNKYLIHYENFSDSDSTNNYISVYTKSHSDWGSSENDGKLREGRVSWKVKARDNAGNETSSSRTLFVDRTSPKVEFTQVNDTPFSSTNFSTTDKTPTIYGKITDSLSGGDSSQTQDESGPKIASGPKQVDIKVEKKEGLGYKLHTLYTINMDKPWYTCDGKEVSDNSKQKCDKYLPFEYTPKDALDLGTYKITLTGKDKADSSSSETSFTLNITTLSRIITPEEKEIIEEEIKELPKEEQEKVKEELEITKPVELSALEKAQTQISQTSKNILNTTGNFIGRVFTGIGNGVRFTIDTTGKALAFVGDKTGQALAFTGRTTSNTFAALYNGTRPAIAFVGQGIGNGVKTVGQGLAWTGGKIGQGVSAIAQGTGSLLASIGQGIGNTGKAIGDGYNQLANNAPGVAKTILMGIGDSVSTATSTIASVVKYTSDTTVTLAQNTGNFIGGVASNIGNTTSSIAQNTTKTIGNITSTIAITTSTIAKNTGSAIASATQNTVNGAKESIAKVSFAIGEKTQDVSDSTAMVFLRIGYSLLTEDTKISNVESVALSSTSVKIIWKTNHPANGKVNWGYEDGIYKFELQEGKRTTDHEFILTNLQPDTEYHYEVMSQNKNYVYDANRKFKTPAVAGDSR